MNIVIVINHFQPKIGYQEFFLAQALLKLGHRVHVVTSQYYFPFPHYDQTVKPILGERKQPVGRRKERGIPTIRLAHTAMSPDGIVLALKNLYSTLKELKPDVVYADGVFFPLTIQVSLCKFRLGFKLVYDSHASTFNSNLSDSLVKRLYMMVFSLFIPLIKKAADAFTAVGTSEKSLVDRAYGFKKQEVKVILLGADTDHFKPSTSARQKVRRLLGIGQNDILFVHAGKLTPEKDVTILLKAFTKLVAKYSKAKLLVIGNGPVEYMSELHELGKKCPVENIIWLPPQTNQTLPDFYSAADVGVWPGNLSNTIQEAMSCGKPVLLARHISASQTTNHLVKDGSAHQFERGNARQLAELMERYVRRPTLITKDGQAARNLIEQEFSWTRIAQEHLKVYK